MKLKNVLVAGALAVTSLFAITSCSNHEETSTPTQEESLSLFGISVSARNTKSDFYIGEDFTSEGLIVNGFYKNQDGISSTKPVTNYTVDSTKFDSSKEGTYEISIIYQEGTSVRTDVYEVNVKSILSELSDPYVKGITASGMNLDYDYMDELDTTGLQVTAVMSDGSTKDVTNDTKLTKDFGDYNKALKGNYELKFSYKDTYTYNGHSEDRTCDTFLIAKVDAVLASISLDANSTTEFSQYTTGDAGTTTSIDTRTWTATATYENGQEETIYADDLVVDYASTTYDSSTPNLYEVKVSYTWGGVTKFDTTWVEVTEFVKPDYDLKISSMENIDKATVAIEPEGSPFVINQGVTIEANGKTYGAQYTFTKRLKLNANGTLDSSSIKVNVENATGAKIVVYAISSSSSEERPLGLYNTEADELDAIMVGGSQLVKCEYTVTEAGTYYIYGTAGAVNIYYVAMWNN